MRVRTYEIFVGLPSLFRWVRRGHCGHPYRNDDSSFTKGMIKMIIPSIGGVRLRGLYIMLPSDSTSTT
ncbi:hypothetical protein RBH38_27675, partial [Escherichia coli]|uniref:hypothetical protein n=1 Tax=Escherichia coli TaxID=562 RepID=UPI002FCBD7DE